MRLIAIIISIIIGFTSSSISFADNNMNVLDNALKLYNNNTNNSSNVKTYKFDNDISMNGVISTTDKFFNVAKNWNIKNAKLNIVFTKSELLDIDFSTITILINDKPIHSEKLVGKQQYKKESTFNIPTDLIKEGYNEVKIKAYKTISDKVCRDDSNTANWIVIHKESNINVEYSYKPSLNLLSEYKNFYINTDQGNRLDTTILIPNNYSNDELSAGMIFSSDFGKKIKYDNFNFDFKLYSDFENKNDNIIYIGSENNTPTEILNLLNPIEKTALKDHCIIKQVNSNFNKDRKMLLIISNKEELLINGAKLMTSNELVKTLNLDAILINELNDIKDIDDYKLKDRITLEKLGYGNTLVKGPFSQEVIMDVNSSKSKVISNGSKVKLNIRYADNLDFNRSLATIYVNDIPIGSKKLTKENSDNDVLEFKFPKELLGKNYYQIKVVFNLELFDLACVTRDSDNPWAYIANDSYIEFNYEDNNELNFTNYPYPFVKNERFNDTVVVIPDSLGSEGLTNVGNILAYMGRDINYNQGNIKVIKISDLSENDKQNNLIIVGTPNNNQLIKDINKNLNLKFDDTFLGFKSDDKIKFVGQYALEVASVQLIESPYNKNKSAMVVASTIMNDLNLSTNYLSDLNKVRNIKGDTIVIGRNGYVKELNYKESQEVKEVTESKKISNNTKAFIVLAIFLLVTLLVSIFLLSRKYKK